MKPCDCETMGDVRGLEEQGIKHNDEGILILDSGQVELQIGNCKVIINRRRFKQFAEWYLADQEERSCENCKNDCVNPSIKMHECIDAHYKGWDFCYQKKGSFI